MGKKSGQKYIGLVELYMSDSLLLLLHSFSKYKEREYLQLL